eukprot:maker-scaffold84_size396325-snap-gene-0.18 protein:Tk09673 transcript:maker-scaffold84_size396325-snap-gene-0.18-mRNA-1 annotation:"eif2 kinase if2k-d (incomplete catalytic triad)"
MAVVELKKCLIILLILYALVLLFGLLASISMIIHVTPQSECLLYSYQIQAKLSYGHYATCNVVAYMFVVVVIMAGALMALVFNELRKLRSHHPSYEVEQKIPVKIISLHFMGMVLALFLTLLTTIGYVVACNNLQEGINSSVLNKLNSDPYATRGEEIQTRYEDDYKFHRYTNRYGNAFGSEFYSIKITCRSILTDPEIHQKLHDHHYEQQSRYYGYWYGQDLFTFNSQEEASKTNALMESTMAGGWLCFIFWLGGFVLMVIQRYVIREHKKEQDRISMHSTMMGSMYQGEGSTVGSQYRRDGSLISGRASSFQRGGSTRGSDRSMKSSRREIDDLALNSILRTPQPNRAPAPSTYGRQDMDDLVINQYINNQGHPNLPYPNNVVGSLQNTPRSLHSSRETGYISDSNSQVPYFVNGGNGASFPANRSSRAVPIRTTDDAIYWQRDEMETEIF